MTAEFPAAVVLEGHGIRLEPLRPDHLPGLWRAIGSRPETFASGYGGGPAGLPVDEAAFTAWFPTYARSDVGRCFVVHRGDEIVGSSSLLNIDLVKEHVEIGCTAYAPEVWGTEVNPAAKLLLLGHAFASGFGRVAIRADAINARSRAAIVKLGATFEGVMRRDMRRADGTWRDTAVHSILVEEWPAVEAGLVARLGA